MLSGIQSFEINPQKTLQLILGKNGSGKSSVLEELSPVPGNKSDYTKGGSKTIHLRHHGALYKLHSVYNSGTGTHSFMIDDEEYNKGRTAVVQ
jgi:recombinational DNA repair ATPase RecF